MSLLEPLFGPLLRHLPTLLLLGVAVGLLALLLRLASRKRATNAIEYTRAEPLTPTERKMWLRLVEAFPDGVIAPQTAMSGLVDLSPWQKRQPLMLKNRGKFSQKRLDFVIFEKNTGDVLCVIELDDHTHDTRAQKAKDHDRDGILEGVGYTVVRFDARKMPSVADLRKLAA